MSLGSLTESPAHREAGRIMYEASYGISRTGRQRAVSSHLSTEKMMDAERILTGVRWTGLPVAVALGLVTRSGAHMNTGDFTARASAVRTGVALPAGITGSFHAAGVADSYMIRAEVNGGGSPNMQLRRSIRDNTYDELEWGAGAPPVQDARVGVPG
jgi:hypothetical protein